MKNIPKDVAASIPSGRLTLHQFQLNFKASWKDSTHFFDEFSCINCLATLNQCKACRQKLREFCQGVSFTKERNSI